MFLLSFVVPVTSGNGSRFSVEFALKSQHETFPGFEIPSRSNFNDSENESRRRPWGL